MNKIFFDTEFTGLHQKTTLLSIGLVDKFGDSFYAEFTDYDQPQITPWLQENVLANFTLGYQKLNEVVKVDDDLSLCRATTIRGDKLHIKPALIAWLETYETRKPGPLQFWSDCLAYDWVLLCDLLADYTQGYPQLPAHIHYMPMDICPLFYLAGVDPDVNREAFANLLPAAASGAPLAKHNALWDARVIQACYSKLVDQLESELPTKAAARFIES